MIVSSCQLLEWFKLIQTVVKFKTNIMIYLGILLVVGIIIFLVVKNKKDIKRSKKSGLGSGGREDIKPEH